MESFAINSNHNPTVGQTFVLCLKLFHILKLALGHSEKKKKYTIKVLKIGAIKAVTITIQMLLMKRQTVKTLTKSSELQIRGDMEDILQYFFLYLNEIICCDPSLEPAQ